MSIELATQRLLQYLTRIGVVREVDRIVTENAFLDFANAIRDETLAFVREDAKLAMRSAPPSRKSAAEELITLCPIHARYFANHLIGPGAYVPFEKDGCCDWLNFVAHRTRDAHPTTK